MTVTLSTQCSNWLADARAMLQHCQGHLPHPNHTIEYATCLGKQVCTVLEAHGGIRDFEQFQALALLPYAQFKGTVARATPLAELVLTEIIAAVGDPVSLMAPTVYRVVGAPFNAASVPPRIALKQLWHSAPRKHYLACHCSGVGQLRYGRGAHAYRLHINRTYLMALEWALRNI